MKIIWGTVDISGKRLTKIDPIFAGIRVYPGVVTRGGFYCSFNRLTSLKNSPVYAPKIVRGDCLIRHNSRKFTEEEIRAAIDVRGEVVYQISLTAW